MPSICVTCKKELSGNPDDKHICKDSNGVVDHPSHYNSHPSGIECIDIVRHMSFNCGNVIKYLWRAGLKTLNGETDKEARLKDLKKARWYLDDEIKMIEGTNTNDFG